MNINQILSPETTFCNISLSSKKKIIEKISQVMAESTECKQQDIFESLFAREKLGTTALGKGIAIPHGRLKNCNRAAAVFIQLENGVDYDAPDGEAVDLIFSIMVPEQANEEQLKCLAQIASIFSDTKLVAQLRHAHNAQSLYTIIEQATEKLN